MSEATITEVVPSAGSGEETAYSKRWWVLAVVSVAQLMVVLDATIVNIALPSAQHSLAFSNADRQWIVTAYSLGFGGLLLLGGRLADLLGRRRTFLVGLIGFAAASALGGAATGFTTLVIARSIQGAFGALLAPAALSALTTTFTDPSERGKAFGIYGAIAGGGGALGLLLGGVLTQYLSWRWCLYVNVGFALVAMVGGVAILRDTGRDKNIHVDLPGTALVVGGLVALVYGFAEAELKGWGAGLTVGLLVAGAILLLGFVVVERRVRHPLLPLRIVLNRHRGGSYIAIGLNSMAMFGVFLFLTYFLQLTLRFSPVKTGLAFLPMVATLMLSSTISTSALLPRVGPRVLVVAGLILGAGGMGMLTQLGVGTSYVSGVLPGSMVAGLGIGLVFGIGMNMATYGAERADAGVASAMVNTTQQVGGSIGAALLNTIAASATTNYLVSHGHGAAARAAATVHGDVVAFAVSTGIFVVAAVLCGIVFAPGVPEPLEGDVVPAIA